MVFKNYSLNFWFCNKIVMLRQIICVAVICVAITLAKDSPGRTNLIPYYVK